MSLSGRQVVVGCYQTDELLAIKRVHAPLSHACLFSSVYFFGLHPCFLPLFFSFASVYTCFLASICLYAFFFSSSLFSLRSSLSWMIQDPSAQGNVLKFHPPLTLPRLSVAMSTGSSLFLFLLRPCNCLGVNGKAL